MPLGRLRVRIADGLGDLPAVLALAPAEQSEPIAPESLTRFRPREAAGDVPIQIREDVGPLVGVTAALIPHSAAMLPPLFGRAG